MKINTMRLIDKYVGIPLTFLVSSLINFYELIKGKNPKNPDISKTLFIELSEMGSAIIADPAMRKLQKNGAELFFLIFKDNQKSLNILATVKPQNIFAIRSDTFSNLTIDIWKFFLWSRKNKLTCVIDLELFSRITSLLTALTFAKSRVGFSTLHDEGCYRGNILTHGVRYNPHVHIAYNFMSLVNRTLGLYQDDYPTCKIMPREVMVPKAEISTEQLDAVRAKIVEVYPKFNKQKIVLINPNASQLLPQRRWPKDNFITVIKQLLSQHKKIIVLITGSQEEKNEAQEIIKQVDDNRCINTAGMFEFDQLAPLYKLATLMLTNDSGPAHFASVTKLEVLVIFGPETPSLYLPLGGNAQAFYLNLPCSPCVSAHNHRKTSCKMPVCVNNIKTETVIKKINKNL